MKLYHKEGGRQGGGGLVTAVVIYVERERGRVADPCLLLKMGRT